MKILEESNNKLLRKVDLEWTPAALNKVVQMLSVGGRSTFKTIADSLNDPNALYQTNREYTHSDISNVVNSSSTIIKCPSVVTELVASYTSICILYPNIHSKTALDKFVHIFYLALIHQISFDFCNYR